MVKRVARRHKWRLACDIVSDRRAQRAIVIDMSKTGLFVQTSARLSSGADVEVRLQIPGLKEPLVLRARVARSKHVPTQFTSVARGGLGLKLREAPAAYFEALEELEKGVVPWGGTVNGGEEAEPEPPARPRFRVRVQRSEGQRSRSIELQADSAEDARAAALAQVGEGWEVVQTDPLP